MPLIASSNTRPGCLFCNWLKVEEQILQGILMTSFMENKETESAVDEGIMQAQQEQQESQMMQQQEEQQGLEQPQEQMEQQPQMA
jgi:hypothetical protein